MILTLKHVFKVHEVGLKCQKFPFWTGFKATRAQTLTHRTISFLTYMVPNIFEGWKKITELLFKSFEPLKHGALLILRLWDSKGNLITNTCLRCCCCCFICNSPKCYLAKSVYIWETFWVIFIGGSVLYFFSPGSCKLPAWNRKACYWVLAWFKKNKVSWFC